MSHKQINLTLPIVTQTIKDVLDDYPKHPYQDFFAIQEFRQQLIDYTLSQMHNLYNVDGKPATQTQIISLQNSPLSERLYLALLIRDGILQVLRKNADLLDRNILNEKSAQNALLCSSI